MQAKIPAQSFLSPDSEENMRELERIAVWLEGGPLVELMRHILVKTTKQWIFELSKIMSAQTQQAICFSKER